MDSTIKDLGQITNIEVIESLVQLEGTRLLDNGCGAMNLSRELAKRAEHVLAIDPDEVQAEKNRSETLSENLQFQECGAEKLPLKDGELDGVFFAYSLHHVPESLYPAVFSEVRRVLKPTGFLYVIEPVDCPWNQVMKLFHDEEQVRAAAQQALKELANPYFKSCQEVTYHGYSQYASFEEYADFFCAKAFNTTYTPEDVRRSEVKEAFENLGGPEHRFQSPKRVMFLKDLKQVVFD